MDNSTARLAQLEANQRRLESAYRRLGERMAVMTEHYVDSLTAERVTLEAEMSALITELQGVGPHDGHADGLERQLRRKMDQHQDIVSALRDANDAGGA